MRAGCNCFDNCVHIVLAGTFCVVYILGLFLIVQGSLIDCLGSLDDARVKSTEPWNSWAGHLGRPWVGSLGLPLPSGFGIRKCARTFALLSDWFCVQTPRMSNFEIFPLVSRSFLFPAIATALMTRRCNNDKFISYLHLLASGLWLSQSCLGCLRGGATLQAWHLKSPTHGEHNTCRNTRQCAAPLAVTHTKCVMYGNLWSSPTLTFASRFRDRPS